MKLLYTSSTRNNNVMPNNLEDPRFLVDYSHKPHYLQSMDYVYFYFRLGHYVLLVWKGVCMFVVRRCFGAGEERVYLNDVIQTCII